MAAIGREVPWRDVIDHLDHLDETEITQDAKYFLVRGQPKSAAALAFQAARVALPPTLRQIDPG